MVLLFVHAAVIPIRIPLAGAWIHPDPSDLDLLTFAIFEGAFVCICAAYLFGRPRRAALKAADEAAIEANGYFTDPDWREVVSPDGVRCFVTGFAAPARQAPALPQPLTAAIPEFLGRT